MLFIIIHTRMLGFFHVWEDGNKHSIFVLNCDSDSTNKLNPKNECIGVKILPNGKLFAGRFANNFKLNGKGIYINKKGHLYLGKCF